MVSTDNCYVQHIEKLQYIHDINPNDNGIYQKSIDEKLFNFFQNYQ